MFLGDDFEFDEIEEERPADPKEKAAKSDVSSLIERSKEEVFFSRQIEIRLEDRYFHWITNRAIRNLVAVGVLKSEVRSICYGAWVAGRRSKGLRRWDDEKVHALAQEKPANLKMNSRTRFGISLYITGLLRTPMNT
jgi:hypothetical protein